MDRDKCKLLIIGSGAAGYSAAIYAARAGLDPVLFTGIQPGGQLTITTDVENYPGFCDTIQGPWLMEQMKAQSEKFGTKIIDDDIKEVDFSVKPFICIGNSISYEADSVIIATGAQAKWIGLDSEKKYQGYGVSGCATCDGFFFKNQKVIVVGGGNTAIEEALFLTNHAKQVVVVHRGDSLRAEKILQERAFANDKISFLWNHVLDEVLGQDTPFPKVNGVKLKNIKTGEIKQEQVDGVFIAIGHKPNTDIFVNKVAIDKDGYIITVAGSTKTNIDGVFAAGDVQDKIYRQAVTAAGSGCMAALDVQKYLNF